MGLYDISIKFYDYHRIFAWKQEKWYWQFVYSLIAHCKGWITWIIAGIAVIMTEYTVPV